MKNNVEFQFQIHKRRRRRRRTDDYLDFDNRLEFVSNALYIEFSFRHMKIMIKTLSYYAWNRSLPYGFVVGICNLGKVFSAICSKALYFFSEISNFL